MAKLELVRAFKFDLSESDKEKLYHQTQKIFVKYFPGYRFTKEESHTYSIDKDNVHMLEIELKVCYELFVHNLLVEDPN